MTMFKPGSELSQYTIIGKLATGGMSEIYLARVNGPLGFTKFVVLKVILPHLLDNPKYAKMFQYEARLAAMLNHPNVVQIFGFDRSDEVHFIAMEYIDGQNLREILKALVERGQRLPRSIALHLVCSACGVLEYAHDFTDPTGQPMRIIHRDVSLENILITYAGQVKLVDFGIAKATIVDVSTTDGKVRGKLHYMAPEMIEDDAPDHRVDIYALGVVLYTSLLMRKPFSGVSHAELFDKVKYEDPPLPRVVDPSLPVELEQIILKAIHKNPDRRYQSAAQMRQDLESYIRRSGLMVLPSHLADFMRSVFPPGTDPVRECYLDLTRLTTTGFVAEDEARLGLSEPYAGLKSPPDRRLPDTRAGPRRKASSWITVPIVETFEFLRPFRRRVLAFIFLALVGLASGALATQGLFAPEECELDHTARPDGPTEAVRRGDDLWHLTLERVAAAPVPRGAQGRSPDQKRPDKRAPRTRPRRGLVSVRAPSPAVAFLDGVRLGRLPLRRHLEPGAYQLTVRSDRLHYSMTRLLRVRPGGYTRMSLSPRKGTLRVYVQPWGRVSLDGRVVGTTPIPLLSVYEGPHQIVVENGALKARRRVRVWVKPGKRRTVRVFLKRRAR